MRSSVPHVLDRLTAVGRSWDWACVVGKAPSFSRERVQAARARGALIVSINDTYVAGGFVPHLVVANDWWTVEKLDAGVPVMTFAFASMPHVNVPPHQGTLARYIELMPCFAALGPRLALYDLYGAKAYVDQPSIESSRSSAEAAVHILALAGWRHIGFVGVGDPGPDYHPLFPSQPGGPCFAGMRPHLERFRRQFGLTYTGLPEA